MDVPRTGIQINTPGPSVVPALAAGEGPPRFRRSRSILWPDAAKRLRFQAGKRARRSRPSGWAIWTSRISSRIVSRSVPGVRHC